LEIVFNFGQVNKFTNFMSVLVDLQKSVFENKLWTMPKHNFYGILFYSVINTSAL